MDAPHLADSQDLASILPPERHSPMGSTPRRVRRRHVPLA